jgi:hypothetical protein
MTPIDWIAAHLAYVWTGWLLFLIGSFGFFEGVALTRHGLSLSMYTWIASEKWPPLIWICGALTGGLAVHFWWHWAPPGNLNGIGG